MQTIITPFRLGAPHAVTAPLTAAERGAFGTRVLDLVLDAGELAHEYAALTLRDRVGGRPLPVTGGALDYLNGTRAIAFPSSGYVRAQYAVPPSYFLACAVDLNTTSDTAALVSSEDRNGNRLFFGFTGASTLLLDHGLAGPLLEFAGAASTGPQVVWASYDAVTKTAEIGLSSITASATATMAGPQKGHATTMFMGGIGTWQLDGRGQIAAVASAYLGGAENALAREAILTWLADRAGAPLAA